MHLELVPPVSRTAADVVACAVAVDAVDVVAAVVEVEVVQEVVTPEQV